MRQHSGALQRKWNRKLTGPIFPAGAKNAVWKRDYHVPDVDVVRRAGGIHSAPGIPPQFSVLPVTYSSAPLFGTIGRHPFLPHSSPKRGVASRRVPQTTFFLLHACYSLLLVRVSQAAGRPPRWGWEERATITICALLPFSSAYLGPSSPSSYPSTDWAGGKHRDHVVGIAMTKYGPNLTLLLSLHLPQY